MTHALRDVLRGNLRDQLLPASCAGGRASCSMPRMALATGSSHRASIPKLLLLTHGHFDHIPDVAKIKRRFRLPDRLPSRHRADDLRSAIFSANFGFALEVEPVEARFPDRSNAGARFSRTRTLRFYEVPGHCPGSLCFFSRNDKLLIGGDVLFAGGVGRWDLPGGDGDCSLMGSKQNSFRSATMSPFFRVTVRRQRSVKNATRILFSPEAGLLVQQLVSSPKRRR